MARWLEQIVRDAIQGLKDSELRITCFTEAGVLTADEELLLGFQGGPSFSGLVRSR